MYCAEFSSVTFLLRDIFLPQEKKEDRSVLLNVQILEVKEVSLMQHATFRDRTKRGKVRIEQQTTSSNCSNGKGDNFIV